MHHTIPNNLPYNTNDLQMFYTQNAFYYSQALRELSFVKAHYEELISCRYRPTNIEYTVTKAHLTKLKEHMIKIDDEFSQIMNEVDFG